MAARRLSPYDAAASFALRFAWPRMPAFADDLKIATWNLDWLTTRAASAPYLPPDVQVRSGDDMARLAGYAQRLDADVVALEEVDNIQAAGLLFPRDRYAIHMTRDRVLQRVGLAVRRSLRFEVNPDLTDLSNDHLRSGADITAASWQPDATDSGRAPEEGLPERATSPTARPGVRDPH